MCAAPGPVGVPPENDNTSSRWSIGPRIQPWGRDGNSSACRSTRTHHLLRASCGAVDDRLAGVTEKNAVLRECSQAVEVPDAPPQPQSRLNGSQSPVSRHDDRSWFTTPPQAGLRGSTQRGLALPLHLAFPTGRSTRPGDGIGTTGALPVLVWTTIWHLRKWPSDSAHLKPEVCLVIE